MLTNRQGAWFDCDDEKVGKMEKLTFDSEVVEQVDLTEAEERAPKPKKSKISNFESSSAYLLVYRKRSILEIEPELDLADREVINQDNSNYEVVLKIEEEDRQKRALQVCERLAGYEKLQNHLGNIKKLESSFWSLSCESLNSAVQDLVGQLTTTDETQLLTSLASIKIDNSVLKCEHGLLNPLEIQNLKKIDTISYDILKNGVGFEISPEFNGRDLCRNCFESIVHAKMEIYQHGQDLELYNSCSSQGPLFWISKLWLQGYASFNFRVEKEDSQV